MWANMTPPKPYVTPPSMPARFERVSRRTKRKQVALAMANAEMRKMFQSAPAKRSSRSTGYQVNDCGSAAIGYPEYIPSVQRANGDKYAETPKSSESLGAM